MAPSSTHSHRAAALFLPAVCGPPLGARAGNHRRGRTRARTGARKPKVVARGGSAPQVRSARDPGLPERHAGLAAAVKHSADNAEPRRADAVSYMRTLQVSAPRAGAPGDRSSSVPRARGSKGRPPRPLAARGARAPAARR